ncbi:MAG: hypothetical protein QXI19_04845, partial [Candidatus Caldarchaeum sp.]
MTFSNHHPTHLNNRYITRNSLEPLQNSGQQHPKNTNNHTQVIPHPKKQNPKTEKKPHQTIKKPKTTHSTKLE